jgi:hypothetical protein
MNYSVHFYRKRYNFRSNQYDILNQHEKLSRLVQNTIIFANFYFFKNFPVLPLRVQLKANLDVFSDSIPLSTHADR